MAATNVPLFDFDVIVVGAGCMGSATAYHLAKDGFRVLLLEQFEFCHSFGSSHGRSRIIRLTYPEVHMARLMPDAYKHWDAAEKEGGFSVRKVTGGLDFGEGDSADLEELIQCCKRDGLEFELLDAKTINERFPLKLPDGFRGVYQPNAAIIDATQAVSLFQDLARSHGAVLQDCEEVTRIDHDSVGVSVTTIKGLYTAKTVAVCPGGWANPLTRMLGIKIPHIDVCQMTFGFWPIEPSIAPRYEGGKFPVYIYYSADGRHFYGFPSHERPGHLKGAPHFSPHRIDYPKTVPQPPKQEQLDLAGDFFRKFFRGVGTVPPSEVDTCLYSVTPKSDFVIDAAYGGRVVLACGFSGHGFKFAPLIGRIVADLATVGDTKYDIAMFRLPPQPAAPGKAKL